MKTYKIISSYPCLIKSDTQDLELDKNSTLILEGEKQVSVYPVGKSDNFAFNIDTRQLDQCPFVKSAQEEEGVIIYILDGMRCQNAEVMSFGNTNPSSIEVGKDYLTFFGKKCKKTIMTGEYKSFDCYRKFDIMLAHLVKENHHLLVAFNDKSGHIKSFRAKDVTIKNDKITMIQEFDDLAGHRLETNLFIDKEGLKKSDCKISYKTEKPHIAYNDRVLPFAFLEAVKAEDYALALSYLSSSLEMTEAKLKTFLSNLDFFFPTADNKFCFSSGNGLKKISFEIKNGKIIDIDIE